MADTSFTNGVTLTDAAWFNDINGAVYKGIGTTGYSTVASATTPDIFASTVSGVINYTGTTTCTGFVASPSAGARRKLVCAGAAVFTAGANMLIDGVTSGNNLTCAANDIVDVVAVSTTQFRLSRTAYSGSSSTTATVGGVSRKAQMSVTTASASATFTADEISVETALGGASSLVLSSYSQTINLATTGAGGMDTGSAPVSGFVSLYAIAKSDGTKNILACAVGTSSGSIYGGANMPAGYTYSALIAIWPTNGSSQFVAGILQDRTVSFVDVSIFSATNGSTSLISQSLSAAVPSSARAAYVSLGTSTINRTVAVASDANGIGLQVGTGNMQGSVISSLCSSFRVQMMTAQTIYWESSNADATSYTMKCHGYDF